nr:immunoglobulin heavy chain junction region [Macaca mulatta]MOX92905.1 immunoglobulin heavy chain junction region [Macaca mulatta]MOX95355.1 immunoglobulin heavy chain junction region [Macaca mulatta]MOX95847.1 immunoglobulin heavy chain junction region [Macaca mulatta]MOX96312.1 immunoglobulin heavy chain junction region [Macaca mulatta]
CAAHYYSGNNYIDYW